jgi:hypothetical protein
MDANTQCPTSYTDVLRSLKDLTELTKEVIDNFFPNVKVNAPMVAKMGYVIRLPPHIYMLLLYMKKYPDTQLNPTNVRHLNNMKEIYLSMYVDWKTDPILSDAVKLGII